MRVIEAVKSELLDAPPTHFLKIIKFGDVTKTPTLIMGYKRLMMTVLMLLVGSGSDYGVDIVVANQHYTRGEALQLSSE